MKVKIRLLICSAVCLLVMGVKANASIIEWSQQPNLIPSEGISFSSETQIPSQVADDFMSMAGWEITGLTWWGSYWDSVDMADPDPNPPDTLSGFFVNIYQDIPAGVGVPPWGHPGVQVYATSVALDGVEVCETYYDTIIRDAVPQTVFKYEAHLPMPFKPHAGQTYWLAIQAIDPGGLPVQWGWQESTDSWNAEAVQIGFSSLGWWENLPQTDMAFEVTAAPLPGAILLFLSGLVGLIGLRARRAGTEV